MPLLSERASSKDYTRKILRPLDESLVFTTHILRRPSDLNQPQVS
jgi:hypothetical protein